MIQNNKSFLLGTQKYLANKYSALLLLQLPRFCDEEARISQVGDVSETHEVNG